jgi:8-oxo-dGTP pyrophosphatase MutT (NUDIX family)
VDPAADVSILVWRRKQPTDELLQIADGKGWRLPYVREIGLRHAVIEGEIGALAEAPMGFTPDRTHRWVRVDAGDPLIANAFRQAGAVVVVWRQGPGGPELLLLHRSHAGPEYEGDWAWTSPGGALDPGERHEECGARELFEETGLDLPITRVPDASLPVVVFTCEARADHEVVLSEEHDRFEWVGFDDACARCRPDRALVVLQAARRSLGWT